MNNENFQQQQQVRERSVENPLLLAPYNEAVKNAKQKGKLSFRNIIICSCAVSLVVVLLLGTLSYSLVTSFIARHATIGQSSDSSTAIQVTGSSLDCPPDSATTNSTRPSLDFCSPIYGGNVAGPVGSHILLIAKNIFHGPLAWAVISTVVATTPIALKNCFSQHELCYPLDGPEETGVYNLAHSYLFSWTWRSIEGFPQKVGNYYIVAQIGSGSSAQFAVSSIAFTLLRSTPPCIVIATLNSSSSPCASAPDFAVKAGQTITISGSNWIFGWKQTNAYATIQIIATCMSGSTCSQQQLFDITHIQPDKNGSFTKTWQIPSDASGKYAIIALCDAPSTITTGASPSTNNNIFVGNALTFGKANDVFSLSLEVSDSSHLVSG